MPKNPERPPQIEIVEMPLFLSSRFESRETSQAPYDTIQAIVREQDVADFSVYWLLQNWTERMSKVPPSQKRWYVVAIRNPPPEPLFTPEKRKVETQKRKMQMNPRRQNRGKLDTHV
jgi:hypothetical protein